MPFERQGERPRRLLGPAEGRGIQRGLGIFLFSFNELQGFKIPVPVAISVAGSS